MKIFIIDRPGLGVLVFMPAYNSGTRPVGQSDDECLSKYLFRCRETGQVLDTDIVHYDDSDNLPDRVETFSEAWEWREGRISTNITKARVVQSKRLDEVLAFEAMLIRERGNNIPNEMALIDTLRDPVALDLAVTVAEIHAAWPNGVQSWPPARPEEI